MNSKEKYLFRKAEKKDIPELAPLILSCLECPNGRTNFGVMFNLSQNEVLDMITAILGQEIPNHEYHFANYMVCEKDGEIISICSGWKESAESMGSENIKTSLIASYLGFDKWKECFEMVNKFAELNIPRQAGFLYLENASTKIEYRKSNIAYTLVYKLIKERKREYPELDTIHSHVFLSNESMYNMFLRFKYDVDQTNLLDPQSILNQKFPVKGLALVSIPIDNYIELYDYNMSLKSPRSN